MLRDQLDQRTEAYLAELVANADEAGDVDIVDFSTPEYRELKRLGAFDSTSEYIDMTARVTLSYSALSHIGSREREDAQPGGRGVGRKVASFLGSLVGSAIKEFME